MRKGKGRQNNRSQVVTVTFGGARYEVEKEDASVLSSK